MIKTKKGQRVIVDEDFANSSTATVIISGKYISEIKQDGAKKSYSISNGRLTPILN